MITEDFVSFETAKLLKEKGFDEPCSKCWYLGLKNLEDVTNGRNSNLSPFFISAPTLQMAMKWLREVHKIHIVIGYTFKADANLTKEYVSYCYQAENANTSISYVENVWYDTYEEACEAAIRYCLENLI
jgi:hypothetical protein